MGEEIISSSLSDALENDDFIEKVSDSNALENQTGESSNVQNVLSLHDSYAKYACYVPSHYHYLLSYLAELFKQGSSGIVCSTTERNLFPPSPVNWKNVSSSSRDFLSSSFIPNNISSITLTSALVIHLCEMKYQLMISSTHSSKEEESGGNSKDSREKGHAPVTSSSALKIYSPQLLFVPSWALYSWIEEIDNYNSILNESIENVDNNENDEYTTEFEDETDDDDTYIEEGLCSEKVDGKKENDEKEEKESYLAFSENADEAKTAFLESIMTSTSD